MLLTQRRHAHLTSTPLIYTFPCTRSKQNQLFNREDFRTTCFLLPRSSLQQKKASVVTRTCQTYLWIRAHSLWEEKKMFFRAEKTTATSKVCDIIGRESVHAFWRHAISSNRDESGALRHRSTREKQKRPVGTIRILSEFVRGDHRFVQSRALFCFVYNYYKWCCFSLLSWLVHEVGKAQLMRLT